VPAPEIARRGATRGAAYLRYQLRRAARGLTNIGVSSAHLGFALGFQTTPGQGGRDGLASTSAWLNVVKEEALAARQISLELGVGSIWSWGWATWTNAERDPAKPTAACVYLWARDPLLCNGPQAAGTGFDAGRDGFAPRPLRPGTGAELHVLVRARTTWVGVWSAPQLTSRIAYVQRRSGHRWVTTARIVLAPFGRQLARVRVPAGVSYVRLSVTPDAAAGGEGFTTPPSRIKVR
jgi:hypothetical protein